MKSELSDAVPDEPAREAQVELTVLDADDLVLSVVPEVPETPTMLDQHMELVRVSPAQAVVTTEESGTAVLVPEDEAELESDSDEAGVQLVAKEGLVKRWTRKVVSWVKKVFRWGMRKSD